MLGRRTVLAAVLGLLAIAAPSLVRADGEAGVVIDYGGSTQTFCVAFEGDSIRGDQLLNAAGLSFNQFGGGARTLCSLNGVGCDDASSFDGCFCECKSGGDSCTYWAFFVQRYGASWQYSTVGFNLAAARDGDLHGWKWGAGGPSSAPPPASTTFESVCGHPPQGGASTPTPTNTTSPPPTATPTQPAPTATTRPGTASPETAPATSTPAVSPSTPEDSPSATATGTGPSATARSATPAATAPTVTVTLIPEEETDDTSDGGGASVAALAGFGALAALLVAGIGFGIVWRRRHGS